MAHTVTVENLPKGRISPSAYECAKGCGEKWKRMYALREQQPPAMPLIVGHAVHEGLKFAALEQVNGAPRPPIEKMLSYAAQSFQYELEKSEAYAKMKVQLKEGETVDQFAFDVKRSLVAFEEQVGCTLQPEEVEELFTYHPPGRPYEMRGKIDMFCKLGFVRDYKTSRRKLDPVAAVASDQLTIYQAHVEDCGKTVNGLVLHGIIMLKDEVVIQTIEAPPRTPEQIEECLSNVDSTVRMINAGIFLKANDIKGMCGYCGFLEWCRPDVFAAKEIAAADAAEAKAKADVEKAAKKAQKANDKKTKEAALPTEDDMKEMFAK